MAQKIGSFLLHMFILAVALGVLWTAREIRRVYIKAEVAYQHSLRAEPLVEHFVAPIPSHEPGKVLGDEAGRPINRLRLVEELLTSAFSTKKPAQ